MKRNYSLIMKCSSLLVSLVCASFGFSARAATMTIDTSGPDVTVKLALPANNMEGVPVSCAFTFQDVKGLLGPSSDPTSQSGFANSAQDLFAITLQPVTKAAFVRFFLTSANGNVILVSDVNERVAKILASHGVAMRRSFCASRAFRGEGAARDGRL